MYVVDIVTTNLHEFLFIVFNYCTVSGVTASSPYIWNLIPTNIKGSSLLEQFQTSLLALPLLETYAQNNVIF